MKDARLVRMKLQAEKDRRLTDGAARLVALIVSDRYLSRDAADKAFPLAWSQVAAWTTIQQRQSYRRLEQLEKAGYLKRAGLKGCPPTNHFVLVFNSAKKGGIDSVKKVRIESAKKGGIDSVKKVRLLISSTPKGVKIKKEGIQKPDWLRLGQAMRSEVERASTTGKNSSLRSDKRLSTAAW